VSLPAWTCLFIVAAAFADEASGPGAAAAQSRPSFLRKRSAAAVRLVTWNVGTNSVFPQSDGDLHPTAPGRPAQFARVMRALEPDVLCLQEITRGEEATASLLDAVLPLPQGRLWEAQATLDNVIAARFDLSLRGGRVFESGELRRGHTMALVDLPDAFGPRDLYAICAHFQSTAGPERVALRQRQADAIAGWIRDAHSPGGDIDLPPGTVIVVLGDLNVLTSDPGRHLRTLIDGDIADERSFGPDHRPDWDRSGLRDVMPRHNGGGLEQYTWRDDSQRFKPGVLDRVLFTDSVAAVNRSFVLNTTSMSRRDLEASGLRQTDVMRDAATGVHDHLPVAVDLVIK
jgi:endonuclease/exonuclease/phosphatase family metal-dependent hydrolase